MGLLDGAFTRLSSVVGSESTLSEQEGTYLTGESEPVKIEHNEQYGAPISILILGRFESPKTQFINAARAPLGTEPYLTGNTKDVYSKRALVAGFKFKLIDTPGFDDPERSNLEVFEKICTYLLDKKLNTGITGIVYIHYAGDSAESRALRQTMEVLSGILGKSCLPHLTIIVVPVGSGGSGHSASVVTSLEKLVDSVFRPIQERLGRSMVSNLEESDITNVLARYATMDPIRLRIQREPPRDLRSFIEASLGYYETDSMKLLLQREKDLAARPYRAKIASLEAALSEQQLFARQYEAAYKQLDNELAGQRYEALAFRQKLQQSRAECSSLRSQLSLQEHIEQSEVIQALKDLNRRIGDIGRSFAACLVDKHIKTMFDKDPGDVTTLDARDLPTLQKLFTHIDGQASLVTSSSGMGMAIEDFLDYSIRYLLCSHLCKRIFSPFHPGVDPSHNKTIALMYDEIQLREPQASSGKWRANCFKSIYRESPDATTQLINKIANDFFGTGFATLIVSFFGDDHNVHFEHNQFDQLKELVQTAWDWNAMLKADVVVLGDFYQSYYQPLSPFEPSWQEEFEPRSGLKADKILCTLALGLISTRAIGGGRPPESTVVCKAMVATESMYH